MSYQLLAIFGLLFFLIVAFALWLNERKKNELLEQKHAELTFSHKSALVKHGKNWEHFVPLMEEFKKIANKEHAVFIGMPIDYIVFDEDAIKFIEVKTGNAGLSKKQKRLKEQIENKNVEWKELRF